MIIDYIVRNTGAQTYQLVWSESLPNAISVKAITVYRSDCCVMQFRCVKLKLSQGKELQWPLCSLIALNHGHETL